MPCQSPHRARRRPPRRPPSRLAGPAIAVILSFLVLSPPPRDPSAATPIRLLPAYAPGFPILFPRPVDIRPREGAVAAADLDGDGQAELIASVPSGALVAVGAGGAMLPGWPRRFDRLPPPAYPVGAPGVGDLDGDGEGEIVACVTSGTPPGRAVMLFAVRGDASDLPGWPIAVPVADALAACPPSATLVVDLDGDGRAEVVGAFGRSEIWAFDGRGLPLPGWPFRPAADPLGRRLSINASPRAADLDGDRLPEVLIVESGLAPRLMALDRLGRLLPHFPVRLEEIVDRQAPAAGDLDADGLAEIVQATLPVLEDVLLAPQTPGAESAEIQPSVPAALHALRHDGSETPGWPFPLCAGAAWGALLADIDGDGRPEVVQGDGKDLYALDAGGAPLHGFPITVHRPFARSQGEQASQWEIADLDLDGRPDFLQARSNLYAGWTQLRILALQRGGAPVRGFPFTLDGLQAASHPVAIDLTGDRRPEVAILATEGTNGGWRLLAWDLAGKAMGRLAGSRPGTDAMAPAPQPAAPSPAH